MPGQRWPGFGSRRPAGGRGLLIRRRREPWSGPGPRREGVHQQRVGADAAQRHADRFGVGGGASLRSARSLCRQVLAADRAALIRAVRAALELRYRLLPYIYSAFMRSSETGEPVTATLPVMVTVPVMVPRSLWATSKIAQIGRRATTKVRRILSTPLDPVAGPVQYRQTTISLRQARRKGPPACPACPACHKR